MYLPDDATETELREMATETRENSRISPPQEIPESPFRQAPRPWHADGLTIDEKIALVEANPYLTKHVKSALVWDLITEDISRKR